ncbi:Reverse transcriptase-like [Sesbania bispinosa]|nr:Reverse transcriptase-like [Sesbania bispinosa]
MAQSFNLNHLICESDALEVVNSVLGSADLSFHPHAMVVLQVHSLPNHDWDVNVLHIARESNTVANTLTSLSSHHSHLGKLGIFHPLKCSLFNSCFKITLVPF